MIIRRVYFVSELASHDDLPMVPFFASTVEESTLQYISVSSRDQMLSHQFNDIHINVYTVISVCAYLVTNLLSWIR